MANVSQITAQPLVCTILPTYNERDNITPLIKRLLACVPHPYLILVVDDNSPDRTWEVVEKLAADYDFLSRVALVRRTQEKGLTSAIQHGIKEAIYSYGAEIITWMDCDLSMPPEEVPAMVRAITQEGADLAVGSRWLPGGADIAHGFMARLLSWMINHFAMLLLSRDISDYTSGFIAARAEVLQSLPLRGDYGEYCIDLLCRAKRAGYRLAEVPYVCVPRTAGESKTGINLWDYLDKGRYYFSTVIRLWLSR